MCCVSRHGMAFLVAHSVLSTPYCRVCEGVISFCFCLCSEVISCHCISSGVLHTLLAPYDVFCRTVSAAIVAVLPAFMFMHLRDPLVQFVSAVCVHFGYFCIICVLSMCVKRTHNGSHRQASRHRLSAEVPGFVGWKGRCVMSFITRCGVGQLARGLRMPQSHGWSFACIVSCRTACHAGTAGCH